MRLASSLAAALAVASLLHALPAAAQLYQWRDANGKMVFSDTPPPPGTPPGNIIKAPKPRAAAPAAAPAGAPAADGAVPEKGSQPGISGTPGTATKGGASKSLAEREADFKKRQTEAAEKAKKDEEAAAEAQRREANCRGLRQNLAAMEGGQRIRRLNDKGEPYFVDDAERAKDIERLRREMAAAKCS
ncbi:MAG: DUF4124 domain-containing protein [Burkholderiales bacterium]|nr:DUF4124 domain-containing protein [Burkholderiales bacterium]